MNNDIDYSIIIPHKNTPQLLNRLLLTIPEQDNIQVIVIDDNSDFSKRPVLDRKNVSIIFLDNSQSKGAGKARNVGLERAKGNWLLFADSDDFFVDDFLDVLDSYKDSNSDMLIFKADSVNSDTLEKSNRHLGINRKIDECIKGEITPLEMALSVQQPWCRMIKSSFVKDNRIWYDEVIASNDSMFTTKCACLAKSIEVSNDVLYVVTYREGSLWNSRKIPVNYLSRIQVAIDRSKYLKSHGLQTIPLVIPYIQYGFIDYKSNMTALCWIVKNRLLFSGLFCFVCHQIKKRWFRM